MKRVVLVCACLLVLARKPLLSQSAEWVAQKQAFEAMWNSAKLLTAKLDLDRDSYLTLEIVSFHLELENTTDKVLQVFDLDASGGLGGLNLYQLNSSGFWVHSYLHPYPKTFRSALSQSSVAISRAKSRTLHPGERITIAGSLFGLECLDREKRGLPTLTPCQPIWEPGRYRLQFDSAASSNPVEFTIQRATLRALAVAPKSTPGATADFKQNASADGEAYVVIRTSDGTNIVGAGEVGRHPRWQLSPDVPISELPGFPPFVRFASTREEIEDINLSLARNGETTVLLRSRNGKRFTVRVDAKRRVLERPKGFEPR